MALPPAIWICLSIFLKPVLFISYDFCINNTVMALTAMMQRYGPCPNVLHSSNLVLALAPSTPSHGPCIVTVNTRRKTSLDNFTWVDFLASRHGLGLHLSSFTSIWHIQFEQILFLVSAEHNMKHLYCDIGCCWFSIKHIPD